MAGKARAHIHGRACHRIAKSIGSSNPHNMIKATFSALNHIQAPRAVAQKRGKRVSDILVKREVKAATGDDAAAAS